MKKLLEYLITCLVENPQGVLISENETEDYLTFLIKVDPEDVKLVIGKNGRTIKAIQEILRVKAIKEKKKIHLMVEGKIS